MIVKYVSGVNRKAFTLNKGYDLAIKECNPHTSTWTYESVSQQFGEKITSFGKEILEMDIRLKFRGTLDGISENLNLFFEECETDVINMVQGSLWFDSEYIRGWFIEREAAASQEFYGWEQQLTFIAPYPFYIREEKRSFLPAGKDTEENTGTGLDYDYDYGYDYAAGTEGAKLWSVDHFASSEFQMIIYGPCENPKVNINGHPYEVFTSLETGEYLTIDSRSNTVIKHRANGTDQSIYDLRGKKETIFDKIPSGDLNIVWTAAFGFDLILYLERGEPTWNLS